MQEQNNLTQKNLYKITEYLKENYTLNYDYNIFNNFLEIYCQEYQEVNDDYEITFGLEFYGQEDGKLLTKILVWKDSYYPEEYETNDFGRALYGNEIEKINERYQKGLEFANELKSNFDFIELEGE